MELCINSKAFLNVILILTGMVVAVSMKIIGAMLVDSLLILPALAALSLARSMRGMFILSVVTGFLSALLGFFISLALGTQPSPAVTFVSLFLLGIFYAISAIIDRKGVKS